MEDTEDAPWGTVETGDFPPIHSAARMRDVTTVVKELESGVDVDFVCERAKNGDGGNTALWYAAQGPWPGGLAVAKLLVDNRWDLLGWLFVIAPLTQDGAIGFALALVYPDRQIHEHHT